MRNHIIYAPHSVRSLPPLKWGGRFSDLLVAVENHPNAIFKQDIADRLRAAFAKEDE